MTRGRVARSLGRGTGQGAHACPIGMEFPMGKTRDHPTANSSEEKLVRLHQEVCRDERCEPASHINARPQCVHSKATQPAGNAAERQTQHLLSVKFGPLTMVGTTRFAILCISLCVCALGGMTLYFGGRLV